MVRASWRAFGEWLPQSPLPQFLSPCRAHHFHPLARYDGGLTHADPSRPHTSAPYQRRALSRDDDLYLERGLAFITREQSDEYPLCRALRARTGRLFEVDV